MKKLLLLLVLVMTQYCMYGKSDRTIVRIRFYYMEGTDLVIRAQNGADHSARLSIFRKGTDPYDESNTITVYPEFRRSRIAVRPTSTDTLFVEPGIMVDSSSDIVILQAEKETIDSMEGALTYWYSPSAHLLETGAIGMSYSYKIEPVPPAVITGGPSAEMGAWFMRIYYLFLIAFLSVAALIAYIFVRIGKKG